MSGKRKRPKLRFDGRYFVTNIYKPDGKRATVSFGSSNDRMEKDIRIAFETWLDLYEQFPHKVLSFDSPYEAIGQITNPTSVSTVGDLISKYEVNFRKTKGNVRHGLEHPDLRFIKRVRQFLMPYMSWSIQSFGPDELEDVKKALLDYEYEHGKHIKKYSRRGINDTLKWIRKIFRWGFGRRIVPLEIIEMFNEVKLLRMGEQGAVDNIRRKKVTEEEFQKVIECVNSVIRDMLVLIWRTGMRPYEACETRPYDILTEDSACWLYIPGRDKTPLGMHKTTAYEKIKVIPLAGNCIELLSQRIGNCKAKDYIFSPKESVEEFLILKHQDRTTPISCGNKPGSNKKTHPMIQPGNSYTNTSLAQACKRACERAGVEVFTPYDLRRTVATNTRAILGKDAAKTLLGHVKESTTDIYLLEEVQEAMKVAKLLASNL